MQRWCLIGPCWEHSHSHKNGPLGVKSSQPENAHKPWRAIADFCMPVYWWYWWILHPEPSPSLHTPPPPRICPQVPVVADVFGHPFPISPDWLSSLPAEKKENGPLTIRSRKHLHLRLLPSKSTLVFSYVLLNCKPSEDEVLQTGVRLLYEIFRKLFASTG